jgi:hypothetical protein
MEKSGLNNFEELIPYRFVPALIAGLAYYLALKSPEAMDRIQMLKAMYDEAWQQATNEDRDRSPWRLIPAIGPASGGGGWY